MKDVEIREGGRTRGEMGAPAHWPFTSCSACSIFNVSQLTAAHTGSLVRNATHATTPAWQAHALVVLLSSAGLPNTSGEEGGGAALTLPVTSDCGGFAVILAVAVFDRKAERPLQTPCLFCLPGFSAHLAQVPGAYDAQPRGRGLSDGQQASLAVVDQWDRRRSFPTDLVWVVVEFSGLVLVCGWLSEGVYC